MLAEVRTEFKLHPTTSGTAAQMAGGYAKYNFYLGTEEECSNLLPHLKSIRRNDLGALMRMGKKVQMQQREGMRSAVGLRLRSHARAEAHSCC